MTIPSRHIHNTMIISTSSGEEKIREVGVIALLEGTELACIYE